MYWLESLSTMLNKLSDSFCLSLVSKLNKLSDSFCLSLVSKLKGKASNILPLRMWTAVGFTYYSFIRFKKLFTVALGIHCCTQAFSSSSEWWLLSSCSVWASHCGGLSCCRALAPGAWASAVAVRGLQQLQCVGSSSCIMRA